MKLGMCPIEAQEAKNGSLHGFGVTVCLVWSIQGKRACSCSLWTTPCEHV